MARFITAGHELSRRSTIKLSPSEKAKLAGGGTLVLHRPVEWSIPGRVADLGRSRVDPGGTDVWGPGPYLKVPNQHPADAEEVWNRVFCPWGYPPDRVRVAWTSTYLEITRIDLGRATDSGQWEWVLAVRQCAEGRGR